LAKDESGDMLADSHTILYRRNIYFCHQKTSLVILTLPFAIENLKH